MAKNIGLYRVDRFAGRDGRCYCQRRGAIVVKSVDTNILVRYYAQDDAL